MRFSVHKSTAHIGQVEIRGVQQVVEFEARERQPSRRTRHGQQPTEAVSPEAIDVIQSRTAIVVPCMDEPISRIASVWAGIPAGSLIILVSASSRDRYALERDALARFCRDTGRDGISVHQRDEQLAKALRDIGMTRLLSDNGLVHEGKGEALVIGIALAAAAPGPGAADGTDPSAHARTHQPCHGHNKNGERNGRISGQETNVRCSNGCPRGTTGGNGQQFRCACAATDSGTCRNKQYRGPAARDGGSTSYYKYIGFIDADNFVTGSVSEYCKAFSAGFHLASAEDAMVRINWGSKPKVDNGEIVFKTSGRSSEVVNRHFNQLLGQLEKKGTCTFSGDACERVEDDQGHLELHHICTGNAGEHAMTMSLALKLQLAGGYAIEPFHFLDIFDRFAGNHGANSAPASLMYEQHSNLSTSPSSPTLTPTGTSPCSSPISEPAMAPPWFSVLPGASTPAADPMLPTRKSVVPPSAPKVQILQIRTMNPHFHDTSKGEEHIRRMWTQGLSSMYHSPLTADFTEFKDGICEAILAGGVKIVSTAKYDPFPPTPPDDDEFDGCSSFGQGIANASRANLAPAECRVYPAAGDYDLAKLREILLRDSKLFWWSGDLEEEAAPEEDELSAASHAQDDASASSATDEEPVQEPLPQRTSRRDSGVDLGAVDGVDEAIFIEDVAPAPAPELPEPVIKRGRLDAMRLSFVTDDRPQWQRYQRHGQITPLSDD